MSIQPGTYTVGPDNGELVVRTARSGPAAKAGHDLVIDVSSWNATLEVAGDPGQSRVELEADGGSLIVRDGTGGVQALGEDDKRGIRKTIDKEILKRTAIRFTSTSVSVNADDSLEVEGELELLGRRSQISFEISRSQDGRLSADAVVKQTGWGIKPYSTLFGTLKVADEVQVTFTGTVGS